MKIYYDVRELLLSEASQKLTVRQASWLDRSLCKLSEREFMLLMVSLDIDFKGTEADPWTSWEDDQLMMCTGKIIGQMSRGGANNGRP